MGFWGRGIDKICDGFMAKGFAEPVFEHNSGGVLCTLYRKDTAALFAGNEDVTLGQNVQKTVEKDCGETSETVEKDCGEKSSSVEKILSAIKDNPSVTQKQLIELTGLSRRGVEWQLKQLKEKGLIRRIGADKGGHWEIVLQ